MDLEKIAIIILLLFNLIFIFIIIKQKIKIDRLEFDYERSQSTRREANLFNRPENNKALGVKDKSVAKKINSYEINLSESVLSEVMQLIEEGKMIDAIKKVRENVDIGLKAAKDYVFDLRDNNK